MKRQRAVLSYEEVSDPVVSDLDYAVASEISEEGHEKDSDSDVSSLPQK